MKLLYEKKLAMILLSFIALKIDQVHCAEFNSNNGFVNLPMEVMQKSNNKFVSLPMEVTQESKASETHKQKIVSIPVEYVPNEKKEEVQDSNTLIERFEKGIHPDETLQQLETYAKQDDSKAILFLAKTYEDGVYVTKDIHKSSEYYLKLANTGHVESQFRIAQFYESGQIKSKKESNLALARRYYAFALRNNHEEAKRALNRLLPEIAEGYESIYRRFLRGKLVYKGPQDQEREFYFNQFKDTLKGEFDLSGLIISYDNGTKRYDVSDHLSIRLGYREEKNPNHKDKIEVWILPKFLMEKEIESRALHYKDTVFKDWPEELGILWTNSTWADDSGECAYVTKYNFSAINNKDLATLWKESTSISKEKFSIYTNQFFTIVFE